MADPTAFYEPEEDELLSSLAVPNYQDHEEEFRRLQELEEHAYAQQIAAAQEAEQEQGQLLELVPEDVKRVSRHLSLVLEDRTNECVMSERNVDKSLEIYR